MYYTLNRERYQVARRMLRLLAATSPDYCTDHQKRCASWDAVWGECVAGIAGRYGWKVAHAIRGGVFSWRDIAQRRYQWLSNDRCYRFSVVQSKARIRAMGR